MFNFMRNKKLFFIFMGAVSLVGGCRQINSVFQPTFAQKWCQERIESHHSAVDEHFARFQRACNVAVRAEFSRIVGDCCCTGGDLKPLESVELSEAEFAVLKSILAEAKPAPYVEDDILAPLATAPKSRDEVPVEVIFPNFVNDALRLYDARGECVYTLRDYQAIVRESDAAAMSKTPRQIPEDEPIVLPDAALERFLALPSYQLFISRQVEDYRKHHLPEILKEIQYGHSKPEDAERCKPKVQNIIYRP